MSKTLDALKSVVSVEPEKPSLKNLEECWKALDLLAKDLNKQFNVDTSLVRLGSKVGVKIPCIATNIPTFDNIVSGVGGIPRGRIIEIYGSEGGGKTTLSLHIAAQEQKNGGIVAFVDAEHSIDPTYAAKLGVDVNNLVVSQPNSGEEALDTVQGLVLSKAVTLIIVDSVAALVPQSELDGESGESHVGQQARLMSQSLRKLRGVCNINGVTVIFINQIREKIGITWGGGETTTGGRALKFYSTLRLDIRKVDVIKEGSDIIGQNVRIKAVKNKVSTPFKETVIPLIYGQGFDIESDIIDYALSLDIVKKSGGWFEFQGENFHKSDLKNKPKVYQAIKTAIDNQKGG